MSGLFVTALLCLFLGATSQMSRRRNMPYHIPRHWRFPHGNQLSRTRRMGNMLTGANVCNENGQKFCCPGWTRTAGMNKCLSPKCTGNCGDGICLQPDRCLCPDSTIAPSCTSPKFQNGDGLCMRRCMNGGQCVANECDCVSGFTGAHCGQPMCGPGCMNGGRCISPTKCSCPYGFTGERCEKDYRTGPCYLVRTNDTCRDELPEMRCSKLACCSTVGLGWGIPCEECPARVGNCPRGTLPPDCNDINECEVIPELCRGGECINTVGSFRCACPEGYTYDTHYKVCIDKNECEAGFCENGECENTEGGFMCTCPPQYKKSQDGSYCISDQPGHCYTAIESGMCTDVAPNLLRQTECCCAVVGEDNQETLGKCFAVPGGRGPMRCPTLGTPEFLHDCSGVGNPITLTDNICVRLGDQVCANGECIALESGDYQCRCDEGYTPDERMKACLDFNECGDGDRDVCGAYGTCVNTDGSYSCHCHPGFTTTEDLLGCLDIDECAEGGLCAFGQCINTRGSFRCSCDEGYRVTPTQQGCVDYNECVERADLCEFGRCVNIDGGFQCVCNPGYVASGDLRSCTDKNECDTTGMCNHGQCINRNGGFECMCDNGFDLTPDGKHCMDVDECEQKPCINGECENLEGDFQCHCHRFQQLDESGRRCVLESRRANCYRNVRNGQCTAANALSTLTSRSECCCAVPGGVSAWDSCEPCPEQGSANYAVLCSGVVIPNVCDMHFNPCANGACINMEGNEYRCECNPGFIPSADEKRCNDIEECEDENMMLCSNGICRNTPGSFVCTCDNGFILNNDVCENVQECESNPCIDGECVDTPGSFECVCDETSQLDIHGIRCYSVQVQMCWKTYENNTCSENFRALTAEECCNSVGVAWGDTACVHCSEIDLPCPKGHRYDITEDKCVDIPECKYGVCDKIAKCVETNGSFECVCPEPLTLDETRTICLDLRVGACFYDYEESSNECSSPTNSPVMRKTDCCCTVGQGWKTDDSPCEGCPLEGTPEFDRVCPDGHGTHPDSIGPAGSGVNECIMYADLCENGKCVNTVDSFLCICHNGYTLEETGRQCIDINECEISPGLCGNGECVNTEGSVDCDCAEGYQVASDGTHCNDINECLAGGRCTGGDCINSEGSYECTCPEGRSISEDGTRCVDVDECAVTNDLCKPHGQCVNMLGYFMCVCNPGFRPTDGNTDCEDIDECEAENGGCSTFCINEIGSYKCLCDEGYTLTYDGHTCADFDECLDQPNRCEGGRCENRDGGFVCVCFDGFMSSPELDYCSDIDECMVNANICLNGKCHNTRGSYTCNCDPGYCVPQGQMLCEDEDECELGKHTCDINADCSNTDGSFTCDCIAGFTGDGFDCIDQDECAESVGDVCDVNGACINTQGSFNCECREGFHGDGHTCSDQDDCLADSNLCGPHGTCINVQGSFECDCPAGFTPTTDLKACKDINECAIEHVCEHGRCHNTPGTFRCDCLQGFEKDEQGANCTDVDECEVVANCVNGECVNTIGDYECQCPEGFNPNPTAVGCVDTRTGDCFLRIEGEEAAPICSQPIGVDVARPTCCCSVYAQGWGNPCEFCPERNTSEYMTLCPGGDGFKPNPITVFLEDIDECMELPGLCQGGRCVNVFGSFICECPEGYSLNDVSRVCEDVDECTDAENVCGPGTCHNFIGAYSCLCPEGWRPINRGRDCEDQREAFCYGYYNGSSMQCTDQLRFNTTKRLCCCTGVGQGWNNPCEVCPEQGSDEFIDVCQGPGPILDNLCLKLPGLCANGVCIGTETGYLCECAKGYRYSESLAYCEDIDECSARDDLCMDNADCVNLDGSYRCNCREGFKRQGERCVDRNECIEEGACANGRCENSVGGFICDCNQGFRPTNENEACEDFDECAVEGACGHGTCQNAVGSFICTCDNGFTLSDNGDCVDIDECEEPNVCRNGICDNRDGSFSCLCNDGYKPSLDGRSCLDINECVEDPQICGEGRCVNMDGSHKCFCPRGYSDGGDGQSCIDDDECELLDMCKYGDCINTPGSFNCICPENFALSTNKKFCVDQTRGKCYGSYESGTCSNALPVQVTRGLCCCRCTETAWGEDDDDCEECPSPGSQEFDDICPYGCGATVNGADINECLVNNPCQNGKCRNLAGGFKCECRTGFKLDDTNLVCIDENECVERGNPCGPGNCVNKDGGFECGCDPGYYNGPMMTCLDINECREPTHGCKFRCVNTDGGYLCTCPDGFTLHEDERSCVDVDECADPELNRCEEKGMICKNQLGFFNCLCQPGYKKIGVSDTCENINECEQTGVCAGGECIDGEGTYECRCNEGYEYDEQGRLCIDRRQGLCYTAVHQRTCEMTGTSGQMVSKTDCCCSGKGAGWGLNCEICPHSSSKEFVKMCPHGPGFDIHGEDIDDCVVSPDLCKDGTCTNLLGSYKCICNRGFMPTESMQECIDIDECAMQNGCAGGSRCRNTVGGYKCECPAGYQITNTMRCVDVDECSTKDHSCQFICINTIGSYHCGCPHGFSMHRNESCVDRDECQEDSEVCGRQAECVNDVGGYHCVCRQGFEKTPRGDGCVGLPCDSQPGVCGTQMCMNMAEGIRCVPGCNSNSNLRFNPLRCYSTRDCRATPCRMGQRCMPGERGEFTCQCDRGFSMMGGRGGGGCGDINECQFQNNPCSYGCKNSFGSFRCGCPRGFFGLGGGHCMQGYGGFQQQQQQPRFGGNPYGGNPYGGRCYDCGGPPPMGQGRQKRSAGQVMEGVPPIGIKKRSADPAMEEISGDDENRPPVNTSVPVIMRLRAVDLTPHQRLIRLLPALRTLMGHTAYKIIGNEDRMFRIHKSDGVHFIHLNRGYEQTEGAIVPGKYKIKVEARPTLDSTTAKRASLNNKALEDAMEKPVSFDVEFEFE